MIGVDNFTQTTVTMSIIFLFRVSKLKEKLGFWSYSSLFFPVAGDRSCVSISLGLFISLAVDDLSCGHFVHLTSLLLQLIDDAIFVPYYHLHFVNCPVQLGIFLSKQLNQIVCF